VTDLLTTREAAKALGFKTTQTFLRWAKRVGFPIVRLSSRAVRVRPEEIPRWIESCEDSEGSERTNQV
jgi:predicted DNA-binding transcriptional regulator AlpA